MSYMSPCTGKNSIAKNQGTKIVDNVEYKWYQKEDIALAQALKKEDWEQWTIRLLPDDLYKYFVETDGAIEVAISDIEPIRRRERGVTNASKLMGLAYYGVNSRRKPVTLQKLDNGKYKLLDGNSTFAIASMSGWKNIYGLVVNAEDVLKNKEKINKFNLIKEGLSKHFTKEELLWKIELFISDKIGKICNDRDEDWCFPVESYYDYKNPGNILCDLEEVKFMVSINKDNLKFNTHLRDWNNCKVQNIKCGYLGKDKHFDSKEDVFVELIKIYDFYNEEQPYENDGSEEWMNLNNDRKRMFSKYSIVVEDLEELKPKEMFRQYVNSFGKLTDKYGIEDEEEDELDEEARKILLNIKRMHDFIKEIN